MAKTWLKLGSYNVICDRCGHKYKADELRKEWTGLMVCEGCWEPRHPQDFLRSVPDRMDVPYVRPRGADQFVPIEYIRINNDLVEALEQLTSTVEYNRTIPTEMWDVLPLNGFILNGFILDGPVRMMTDGRERGIASEHLSYELGHPVSDTAYVSESLIAFLGRVVNDPAKVNGTVSWESDSYTNGDGAGAGEELSYILVPGTSLLNGFIMNGVSLNG